MYAAPGSAKKSFVFPLIVLSLESLNSEYERMCGLCVRRVTDASSVAAAVPIWGFSYPILMRA
jgi:hypothetical protein